MVPKEERKLRPGLGLALGLACLALKLLAPALEQYEFFRFLSELDWGPLLIFSVFMSLLGLFGDWLPPHYG